jgi:YYY domain-containing protein
LVQIRSELRSISWRKVCWVSLAVLSLWIVWAIVVMATGGGVSIWGRLGHLIILLIPLALILFVIVRRIAGADTGNLGAVFTLLLFFAALLLTIGCEIFYVEDVFGNRMNTVFRFYYQSWVLFSIASAFSLYYILRSWKASRIGARLARFGWWGLLILLVLCSLIYPIAATLSKTNGFSTTPTLNGLAWHQSSHPEEWEAISWINSNVEGAPVIVEAPGGAYTDHSRVSTYTGLPTIIGWEHHEGVWRPGCSDCDLAGRKADVDRIYEFGDWDQVKALLEKYRVTYIYVGRLEREMYGAEVGEGFEDFMDVVFENDGVTIYKVRE